MDLGALYDAWADRLLAYMMTITRDRDRAEDALHNLFVKLAAARPDIRETSVYLFRAARNEGLRAAGRRPERPLADLEVVEGGAGPADAAALADALDGLPEEQRDVVLLHALNGLTFREIGETLDIPADTAASRYRYGIEKLRERWV
jgi:RNA polymerase sigma-70 factor, ECF subfamily